MNTGSPARAGAVASGSTVSTSGAVDSAPTRNAGTVSSPSRRGCSATANSTRGRCPPPATGSLPRVLLWPLSTKSGASAEKSGIRAPAWSVSMLRVVSRPRRCARGRARRAWPPAPARCRPAPAATPAGAGTGPWTTSWPAPAAALVFEAEARAQQAARIVRHAAQPGLHGFATLALGAVGIGLRGQPARGLALTLAVLLARRLVECALHALALGGVGLRLVAGPVGRRRIRGVRGSGVLLLRRA